MINLLFVEQDRKKFENPQLKKGESDFGRAKIKFARNLSFLSPIAFFVFSENLRVIPNLGK